MDMWDYQQDAIKTAIYPDEVEITYPIIGLANEAGEVLGVLKKVLRDDSGRWTDLKAQKLKDELGDVLWYIALTCEDMGWDMGEIARANLAKLRDRQERGVLGGSGDNR